MRKFWNWTMNAGPGTDEERELTIDGAIAEESWFDDDVTPELFRAELNQGRGPVTVWINSPGGDVFAASQIYTMLMEYPAPVTVKVDGIAASAASVIAMAGSKVLMAPTAMMMIHNPLTAAFGDEAEMQKAIEMLAEVKESIINAYELKTSMQRAKIARLMDAETWMNAKKAIELGFADGMLEDRKTSASAAFDFGARTADTWLIAKAVAKATADEIAKSEDPARTGKTIEQLLDELNAKA